MSDQFVRDYAPRAIDPLRQATPRCTRVIRREAPQAVFELGVPVLGICYGMQTMAAAARRPGGERAWCANSAMPRCAPAVILGCCDGIQDRVNGEGHGLLDVWMSHGDKVTAVPPGFKLIASNAATPDRRHGRRVAQVLRACSSIPRSRIRCRARAIFERFVHVICGLGRTGTCPTIIEEAVGAHPLAGRQRSEVILGLSGGVDSAVAAALIHRAIGEQLTCVFVDTGLLRLERGGAGDGDLRAATSA